jgi:hypothetical protein
METQEGCPTSGRCGDVVGSPYSEPQQREVQLQPNLSTTPSTKNGCKRRISLETFCSSDEHSSHLSRSEVHAFGSLPGGRQRKFACFEIWFQSKS